MQDVYFDFSKAIIGALKCQIDIHGPITAKWINSATKRINGAANAYIKQMTENKQEEIGTQPTLFEEEE